jgi:hypothetical protein
MQECVCLQLSRSRCMCEPTACRPQLGPPALLCHGLGVKGISPWICSQVLASASCHLCLVQFFLSDRSIACPAVARLANFDRAIRHCTRLAVPACHGFLDASKWRVWVQPYRTVMFFCVSVNLLHRVARTAMCCHSHCDAHVCWPHTSGQFSWGLHAMQP